MLPGNGVNRAALSPEDIAARKVLIGWARDRNFEVGADAIGNLLEVDAREVFVVDSAAPSVRLLAISPNPRSTAVEEIDLIFNTTEGWQSLKDSEDIRRSALMGKVPYFTTAAGSVAAAQAISALRDTKLEVRPLQSYHLRVAR